MQYAGWALINRDALMPDRDAVDRQAEIVEAAREQLAGIMNIDFVTPGLFRHLSQTLHGRLGARRLHGGARRHGAALPRRADDPFAALRTVRRAHAGRDLDGFTGVQRLSRHRLDAGAVPKLRAARDRLGRLPMPGDGDRRRRRRDRSRPASSRRSMRAWQRWSNRRNATPRLRRPTNRSSTGGLRLRPKPSDPSPFFA